MSDLERFVEIYKSVGIDLTPEASKDGGSTLTIQENCGGNPKIDGYTGFFTTLNFDVDGNFLRQGIWE